ncbi:MAG: lipoyl(octanoyl) transferase LipB [Oligoflexia bacterium]|nr:lipoyl(octanoyl) transferase LipB [Oligoflexia bacterium]
MSDPIHILSLGRKPYSEVWELQKSLQRALIDGSGTAHLILCEHTPVITIGRSGSTKNVLVPSADLQRRGVELFEIERGGDVTYHGPGQLVAYPIIDLNLKKRDVGWYMRSLEQVVIQTLDRFGVHGERIPGKSGVWTPNAENAIDSAVLAASPRQKISSIGVRISRWCTLHGLSLNVDDCRSGFQLINPCGFTDIGVTSIEQETKRKVPLASVQEALCAEFLELFDYARSL